MPDPYYNVNLIYLGYIKSCGALMVSTDLPPSKIHWLPDNLVDGQATPEDVGKPLNLSVSSWWLKREGLDDLCQPRRSADRSVSCELTGAQR